MNKKNTEKNNNKTVKRLSIAITVFTAIAFAIHVVALVYIIIANQAIRDPQFISDIANRLSYSRGNGVSGSSIIIGTQQVPMVEMFQQGLNYILFLTIIFIVPSAFTLATGILGIIFHKNQKKMKLLFIFNLISIFTSFLSLQIIALVLTIINSVNVYKAWKPKPSRAKKKGLKKTIKKKLANNSKDEVVYKHSKHAKTGLSSSDPNTPDTPDEPKDFDDSDNEKTSKAAPRHASPNEKAVEKSYKATKA